VSFELGCLFVSKPNSSKFARNSGSQAVPVPSRFGAASLFFNAVAENCIDFLGQRSAVPFGSALKETLHGRFDFANDDLSEH
jgi:hypothetical protein